MNFRKTTLVFVMLAMTWLSTPVFGDELSGRVTHLKSYLDALYHGLPLPVDQSLGEGAKCEPCGKCGTPAILEAMALAQDYGEALGFSQYFKRPFDTVLTSTYNSPAGHFKVHYTTVPRSDQIDMTDNDHNGIPDYAEIVGRIADSVWDHHVKALRYHEPLNDAAYYWGGDSLYDIYVFNVGSSAYGFTQPDTTSPIGNGQQVTSWMAVDNNYSKFEVYKDRPIEALQVTVAHEFFHAIQFWYDATEACQKIPCSENENPYWMEMSAVCMEELTYDNVNDYYLYLKYYLPFVHKSIWTNSADPTLWHQLFIYGAGLFPIYLTERFGVDIMKKAWEHCADRPLGNFLDSALQVALAETTNGAYTFEDIWTEYSRWLYFTGTRGPSFFEEGANYVMIPTDTVLSEPDKRKPYIRVFNTYPLFDSSTIVRDYSFSPEPLGMNYLVFRTASLPDSTFSMAFTGTRDRSDPLKYDWRLSVMATDGYSVWVDDSLYHNSDGIKSDTIKVGFADFHNRDIVIVPTLINVKPLAHYPTAYNFSVLDTSVTIEDNIVTYGPTKLFDSDTLTVSVQVTEQADVTLSIFTVAGEKIHSESRTIARNDYYSFRWKRTNSQQQQVASGVYVALLQIGGSERTFKVLVIR